MASRRAEITPALWVLALSTALFLAAGFALWLPSQTGGPLCDPDSLLQGHAAWHLLPAATTGCFYVYWCSEDRTGGSSGA